MHDQDPALYATLIYEICVEASQGSVDANIVGLPSQEEQKVVVSSFPESIY